MGDNEKRYTHEQALGVINGLFQANGLADVSARLNLDCGVPSGVHIENSYKVKQRALRAKVCGVLAGITGVKRPASDFAAEWVGHNLVFRLLGHREIGSADLEFAGDKRGAIRFLTGILRILGVG